MQFALLIYHSPEEFAVRENDYNDPHLAAWRAYAKALVEAGVYVGGNALEVRPDRPYVFGRESAACRTDPMQRRRSNWEDSSSWKSLPWTKRSSGLHDARVHRSARWKSGRWRLKPCGGGLQVNEAGQEGFQSAVRRTIERVARESYSPTAAWWPIFPSTRTTWRAPRMRSVTRWWRRLTTGRKTAFPKTPRPG